MSRLRFRTMPLFAALTVSGAAAGAPLGGIVKAGQAGIAQTGAKTTITQTSDRAVIDWRSFDTTTAESVTFLQPSAQSAVLNRVTGSQATSFAGTLTANGQVYLVNPNGILIGGGATVNANSFVATTANIATSAFMSDPAAVNSRYAFDELTAKAASAAVINAGTITVADGGLVALVAPGVKNSGTIVARLGKIELASATHFTLDLAGDDLIRLAVGDSIAATIRDSAGVALTSQVDAGGQLTADGGRIVVLSVPAAAGVVNDAINLSGIARARSVAANRFGGIDILANNGTVTLAGTVDVSSALDGVAGGAIDAIGSGVHVTATASLNASGLGGGGRIVLGGDYTAGAAGTITAQTLVDSGARVRACGTAACATDGTGGTGAGGVIRVYSGQGTTVGGELNVSSGAAAQAGTVEVISNNGLTQLNASAHLSAVSGAGQPSGFIAIIGDTLAVNPSVFIDLRDTAGGLPDNPHHLIYDSDPASGVRSYVRNPDPDQTQLQTDNPLVFHAYAGSGLSGYENSVPPLSAAFLNIFASGVTTPVGTLRPTAGAPSTPAASAADPLTAIPIALSSQPPGSDAANILFSQSTTDVVSSDAIDNSAGKQDRSSGEIGTMLLWVGGPGVAQTADLGRTPSLGGASVDVFNANFQVLAPRGGAGDTQIADYLCRTPYRRNACK